MLQPQTKASEGPVLVSNAPEGVEAAHLAKLRADKIVKTRREAQTIYYSIASPEIYDVLAGLQEVLTGEEGRSKTLETPRERQRAS